MEISITDPPDSLLSNIRNQDRKEVEQAIEQSGMDLYTSTAYDGYGDEVHGFFALHTNQRGDHSAFWRILETLR